MTRPKRTDGIKTGSAEARRRSGKPTVLLSLPAETLRMIDKLAKRQHMSRSVLVNLMVVQFLEWFDLAHIGKP